MIKNKITIIIPIYNTKKDYLKRCIESTIEQTNKNIEILLINDGSNEETRIVCEQYLSDTRVKLINKENEGVSIARNVGIKESTGDLIMFLDSDDWIEKETCQTIINEFNVLENDILIFNGKINYLNDIVNNDFYIKPTEKMDNKQINDIIIQTINKNNAIYKPKENTIGVVWGKVYKRDYIINNNFEFNSNLKRAEDHIFWLNILITNPSIKYIDKHLYNYRQSESSTVNKYTENVKDIFKQTLSEMYKIVGDLGQGFMEAYYARAVSYVFTAIKNDYFHKNNKKNFNDKINGIKEIINEPIYKEAISNVNIEYINKKQKLLLFLLKRRMWKLMYITYRSYGLYNFKRRKKCI